MRVVVTGALGHIGSRLIRELAAWPATSIVMIDNLATERYASLYNLPAAGNSEFIKGDVLTADLTRLFDGADAVVHLAALTDGTRADLRAEMERVNREGAERVARACQSRDVALLFPSTTSVYGTSHGVVGEDCVAEDLRPQSPYAGWKLQSEDLLRSLGRREGPRFVIFRMGTIFGPSVGMRFHTAVNQFCWRAAAGQPIQVWRTAAHQFRPYLDLTDAVAAMMFVLERRQFDGRVYNVLTLNATVTHVVDVLSTFVRDLRIATVDSPLMNELSFRADNTAFTRLGFDFTGSLASGIGDTIRILKARGAPAATPDRAQSYSRG